MDTPVFMPQWLIERIQYCVLSGDELTTNEFMLFDNAISTLLDNGFERQEVQSLITIIGCIAKGHQHITEHAINPTNFTDGDFQSYGE